MIHKSALRISSRGGAESMKFFLARYEKLYNRVVK